jgi:hypothetical protein
MDKCSIYYHLSKIANPQLNHFYWINSFIFILISTFISLAYSHLAQASSVSQIGKYPASLLVKTRTATIYPQSLKIFTWVTTHADFKKKRDVSGNMQDLPAGLHHRRTTSILWGEYGLNGRFQMGIGIPFIFRDFKNETAGIHDTPNGLGDIWLYGKYKFIQETLTYPALAGDIWVKTTSGDKNKALGSGYTDVKLTLEISKRYNDLSLHLNPEYTFSGGSHSQRGNAADNKIAVNFGAMYHMNPKIVPMFELNGLWWGDIGHSVDLGAGALFFIGKTNSLKLSVSLPVDIDMPWRTRWTPWIKAAFWF